MAGATIANLSMVDGALRGIEKVQSYVTIGMEDIIEVSLDLAETAAEGDGTDVQLEDLKRTMEDYAHMEQDLQQYVKAVKQVKGQLQKMTGDEQMNADVSSLVGGAVAAVQREDGGGGGGGSSLGHKKMDELREKLRQYRSAGESMPSTSAEPADDDDVIITQCELTTMCPITRCEMTDPVTNRHCSHSYERAAILQIVRNRRNAKCPVTGCGNQVPISKADLVDNRQLKSLIETRKRQESRH